MSADMMAKLARFAGHEAVEGHARAHLEAFVPGKLVPFPKEIEDKMPPMLAYATVYDLVQYNSSPSDREFTDSMIEQRYKLAVTYVQAKKEKSDL